MELLVFNAACSCGAMGPDADSTEEAVERWNRRVSDERFREIVNKGPGKGT
jgi:hypothetical protein